MAIRRRTIDTEFVLDGASEKTVAALALRRECVLITVRDAPAQDVLT